MLSQLQVKNFGIIEDLSWELSKGFNVITGETGAGKSLVIDAVEIMLKGKADDSVIRFGMPQAYIEGIFTFPSLQSDIEFKDLLMQPLLSKDEDTVIINCLIKPKSTVSIRINGQACTRTQLHQIGNYLVDIHGQSDHLSLLDSSKHLDILDAFAGTMALRRSFATKFAELKKLEQEQKELSSDVQKTARQEEFLRFEIEEITNAQLHDGEEEELTSEINIIAAAEKLKSLSDQTYQLLNGDDANSPSALENLNQALFQLKKLVELDGSMKLQLKALGEATINISEMARDILEYETHLAPDPERLEQIEIRLELIRNLKRKYGSSIRSIQEFCEKARDDLMNISGASEKLEQLAKTIENIKRELGQIGNDLSQQRQKVARDLEVKVETELRDLNMIQVRFVVLIERKLEADGIPYPDNNCYAFSDTGGDIVYFTVSTNPGEPAKPLARIASTGELSRFTLALMSALSAASHMPTLIFDEIDIGIGGRSGEIIGQKLWRLSQSHQVICITHLPQIAAFADAHFRIHKKTAGDRTVSSLESLDDDIRIEELAVMLGGPRKTSTSKTMARDLLKNASAWKKFR